MIQQNATILFNTEVGKACWHMGLACDRGYDAAIPGQFVMLQINAGETVLLRRPFSIYGRLMGADGALGFELLYKVVGRATEKMSGLKPDGQLNVLGPLGRGFKVKASIDQARFYLVAGGIGVAPIRFLASYLYASRWDMSRSRVFLGGRTQDDLLCRNEFERLGIPSTLATDDGSTGAQCLITDPLATAVQESHPQGIFACGPHGMLQCVAGLAHQYNIPCQLSMETMMACGIGACLGCAIKPADHNAPYLHVCKDGPVFEAANLVI